MYCNICHSYNCNGVHDTIVVPQWTPSTTVERGCYLVRSLLGTLDDCDLDCPDTRICRMMRLECELHAGRLPLGTVAMLAAARMLETDAIAMARIGTVSTLTIKYAGAKTSDQLRTVAVEWRESALAGAARRVSFAFVGTGTSCLNSCESAYLSCGCNYRRFAIDDLVMTSCDFDCCDDCEE